MKIKYPCLQLSGCFYTIVPHTNTLQQEQKYSGFELTPRMKTTKMSPVLESLLCPGNTSVIYNQLSSSCKNTIILLQAPCSLPYLKSFMRNPAKNNTWSPLGSGHENGGIH